MAEMNERELLNALLHELRAVRVKVDSTDDRFDFRKETANNFNKIDRRLRFIESDYEQLNERVDKLELRSNL
ncbi:hypothetical protein [Paenibacillus sp. HJGM_3]|uniref:hypothetical protein n=1 Tax=Paenibacillus sp. HJGM_3 TaxID=3379816 RepID=UPI00385ECB00